LPGGGAQELVFERLAGKLAFHVVFRFLYRALGVRTQSLFTGSLGHHPFH
jgi:hypothetical protein